MKRVRQKNKFDKLHKSEVSFPKIPDNMVVPVDNIFVGFITVVM